MTYSETKYHTCIYCNQLLTYTEENRKEVAKHYWRSHYNLIRDNYNFSIGNLILELFYNNTYPKCDCGCKEDVTRYNPSFASFRGSIKGHQYKTKKNIPKLTKDLSRICPRCNQLTIYDNYDSKRGAEKRNSICKKCKKEKELPNVLERNCPDCNDVIIYKNKYDCFEGKNKNSKCPKCVNISNQCKNYIVENLSCQGTFEKGYIETLVKENKMLPIKPKGIKTSIGYYHPDFEFPNEFIEIKSMFTWEVSQGLKLSREGIYNDNQYKKILEVSKTIKPVKVIIFKNSNEVLKEILFN